MKKIKEKRMDEEREIFPRRDTTCGYTPLIGKSRDLLPAI